MNLKTVLEKNHKLLLAVVFVVAIIFRFLGINWGMPNGNLHPDEGIIYEQAYECALNHSFEVREYYRPNHVTIKLNTLLYLGIQEAYFAPKGETEFYVNYELHLPLFIIASRILTALFGMGTVFFAYLIGRLWGKNQALVASLLFAVFPSFIEHSHYITPDIPLLFFLMGVLWASLKYYNKPSIKWLFWMSFFASLGMCEKYPGVYGCVIIAVAVLITYWKKPVFIIKNGILSIAFFLLSIMAVSPNIIVDFRSVLEAMFAQNMQYHLGGDGLNFGQTLVFYVKTVANHMGFIATLLFLYGVVRSIMKETKASFLLIAFLAYIFPISYLSVHWERYALPIYAGCLLFASFGVCYAFDDLCLTITKNKKVIICYCLLVCLSMGSLFAGAMAISGRFLAPDSRIYTQSIISEMNVTTDNTVYDCNTPLDPGGYYGAFSSFEAADPEQYKYGRTPTFVMTSSAQRDLYFESDPEVYGWIADFYHRLDEEYPCVYIFTVENPGNYFIELQNIYYSARSVYRYLRGASTGYEIRLYQLMP